MATTFIESPRFPDDISYGSRGGPTYRTNVVVVDSGEETRNQQWEYPRHEYDVAFGVKEFYHLQNLISYFHVAAGRFVGFRYKDWNDFKSCQYSSDTITSSDCVQTTAYSGATTYIPIYKSYNQGGFIRDRRIRKPISTSVLVSVNSSIYSTANYTVDSTRGRINFNVVPSTGVVIKAGFEFDVPVRFDTDSLAVNFSDYQAGIAQVPLIEIKVADT